MSFLVPLGLADDSLTREADPAMPADEPLNQMKWPREKPMQVPIASKTTQTPCTGNYYSFDGSTPINMHIPPQITRMKPVTTIASLYIPVASSATVVWT